MSEPASAESGTAASGFEELARGALLEVTDARSVGPLVSETDEGDGVVSLRFESNLPGYLGWKWTVSVAKVGDAEPTVLESELMPGDGALLAPEWVPWSDRLDEYNAGRAAAEGADEDDLEDEDLEDDDLEDEDLELEDDLLDVEDLEDADLGDDEYDGVDVDSVLDEADDDDLPLGAPDDDADDSEEPDAEEPDAEVPDADVPDGAVADGGAGASDAASVGVDQAENAQGDAGGTGPENAGSAVADEAEERGDERE
jgi:hypothetical protein